MCAKIFFNTEIRRPQLGDWDDPATCVTGIPDIQSGAQSIADPRLGCNPRAGTMGVQDWNNPANTVAAAADVHQGTAAIADPRFECDMYPASYGVQSWDDPAVTVRGNMRTMCSPASVADPRVPGDKESGVWVIIAEDGTWHRPLTTLELAALQGFPLTVNGKPLVLAGKSDARWREAIGNAVPPPAARAIGDQILTCLLASEKGDVFTLTTAGVWVREEDYGTPRVYAKDELAV